jgi:hypothetical protein
VVGTVGKDVAVALFAAGAAPGLEAPISASGAAITESNPTNAESFRTDKR